MKIRSRETLARAKLLGEVRAVFKEISEGAPARAIRKRTISTSECLMSGLAVFGLPSPSLFDYAATLDESITRYNLEKLYGVQNVPRDTYLRERLDEVNPRDLRGAFSRLFSKIQ